MIDRANAMLPRPPIVTSNGPNGEIESDSASTELTTPAHRRFASSPLSLFSGGSSGTKTPLSLVSPPLFQPFTKTTTTSTLMAVGKNKMNFFGLEYYFYFRCDK